MSTHLCMCSKDYNGEISYLERLGPHLCGLLKNCLKLDDCLVLCQPELSVFWQVKLHIEQEHAEVTTEQTVLENPCNSQSGTREDVLLTGQNIIDTFLVSFFFVMHIPL